MRSALVCLCLALVAGCDSTASKGPRRGPASQANSQGGLFDSVAQYLDRLEQFDANQILPQISDRLNQWYQQEKPTVAWQADPLVAALPEHLKKLPVVQDLGNTRYTLPDAWYLQEAVWLRDISKTARADQFDDVAVAEQLFDWTVRNIQLEGDVDSKSNLPPLKHRPHETLLFGRGQAIDRAWIFILLARQQGLDVVMLGVKDDSGAVRPWLPALLSKGELYLFDCRLGLPIRDGEGRVATLAQVADDESLLRKLDVSEAEPYPLSAKDVQQVVAFVEGSPSDLSIRMALVESRLTDKRKMTLTSPASALAEQVKKCAHVVEVRLWPLPFETWLAQSKLSGTDQQRAARELALYQAMPPLLTARSLYFKGVYDGEKGAKRHYLNVRPPQEAIDNFKLPKEAAQKFKREVHSKLEAAQVMIMTEAKQNASFWLGLVHFQQGDYQQAIDFFAKRTLEASPGGPWTPAARYNLARCYEATGEIDKAIALYESDKSAQSAGNKLRARKLKEAKTTKAAAE